MRPPYARPPYARPPIGHLPGYRPWYPGHPGYGGYRPGYWWRPATAAAVTGWFVGRWTTPVYYSYGSGGSVYYEGDTVYVQGEPYGSAEQYYTEAYALTDSVPEMTEEQATEVEWMPLGVFAITQEGVSSSSMYLQLAVSKDGIIAGTFYNEATGATHPVEGMIDQETQRAAWRCSDGENPDVVMETGIYNLTQDQAEVLVHFGPDVTQTWTLVRLDESERPEE